MLLTLALVSALHAASADSVPGTWKITGDVMGNPLDQTCTLKQADTTLTGTCTGPQGEALPVTGAVKDGKVTFKYPSDYQGTALTIVFTGTFAAPKQLKGSIEVQPMGVTGTFTAAPAPAKP
jgi:hypothetical protein